MANAEYKFGAAEIARGNFDFLTGTIKAVYVDTGLYTVNLTTDQDLADIPSGARLGISEALTSKTISDAMVMDAADFQFVGVPVSANDGEALVYFLDTGVEATSTLWLYVDTGTGMVQTPDGNNISVTVNAAGIYSR